MYVYLAFSHSPKLFTLKMHVINTNITKAPCVQHKFKQPQKVHFSDKKPDGLSQPLPGVSSTIFAQ